MLVCSVLIISRHSQKRFRCLLYFPAAILVDHGCTLTGRFDTGGSVNSCETFRRIPAVWGSLKRGELSNLKKKTAKTGSLLGTCVAFQIYVEIFVKTVKINFLRILRLNRPLFLNLTRLLINNHKFFTLLSL